LTVISFSETENSVNVEQTQIPEHFFGHLTPCSSLLNGKSKKKKKRSRNIDFHQSAAKENIEFSIVSTWHFKRCAI
jgi:hypothetical protein